MIPIYCFNFQPSSYRLIFEKKQEKITWRMIILRCVLEFLKCLGWPPPLFCISEHPTHKKAFNNNNNDDDYN